MSDITLHIKELLFRHDCVILPEFGAFIGNYRPAGIDTANNRFTPPLKAISFNRNLTHNDGLLIGKISEELKIGYADSKRIVDEYVDGLKRKLEKGERLTIEKVGYFQLNSESNIEFEPDRDSNFLLDSYGFGSFTREPLSNFDMARKVSGKDRMPIRTSSTRRMAIRAAIAVPIVVAMIIVPLKTDLFKSSASFNPMASIELDKTIEEAPVLLEQSAKELVEVNMHYYIVAGSFKNEQNALALLTDIEALGFKGSLVDSENGFYRVSLDSFSDKQAAIDKKSEILADYPDCWILKK